MKKNSRAARRKRTKPQSKAKASLQTSKSILTPSSSNEDQIEQATIGQGELVAYDENLLERARTQWQFGDWESLVKIERETLQHHPDRAKLALLAAAGHLQQGNSNIARQFTRLAQDWGCSKKLISQILIAGVHNSLGRAAAINGQGQRALQHFENAIAIGAPASELRLLTQARLGEQLGQLSLPGGTIGHSSIRPVQTKLTIDHT